MTQETGLSNPAFIKIFGERNTGTRAVAEMLRQLPGVTLRPPGSSQRPEPDPVLAAVIRDKMQGRWAREYRHALRDETDSNVPPLMMWKHGCPVFDDAYVRVNARVIMMVRDPYSWAMALWRHPYHVKGPRHQSAEQFLTYPWMTERRDAASRIYASPVQLWSAKLAACEKFARLAELHGVAVQYLHFRDFLPDPVVALARVMRNFGVVADGLCVLPFSTNEPNKSLANVQCVFANEARGLGISDQCIEIINQYVDWRLAARFGYSRISERKTGAAAAA